MIILGVNNVYHEHSATILRNGELIAAAEEERFNRYRHGKDAHPFNSWQLPWWSINFCLEKLGISLNQVDYIAFSYDPDKRFQAKLPLFPKWLEDQKLVSLEKELGYWYFNKNIARFLTTYLPKNFKMRERFNLDKPFNFKTIFVEHHLAHAASAFFYSPFSKAAIVSIDGIGETTATLLALGQNNSITKLREFSSGSASLGLFYEELCAFLGFQKGYDEQKIMAMSAYGNPEKFYSKMKKLLEVSPGGIYKTKINFGLTTSYGVAKEFINLFGQPRLPGARLIQKHFDIAAAGQKVLEEAIFNLLNWLYKKTETPNLCLAGGVTLNCLANGKITANTPFKNLFIQPAANDAGTSLGAALYVYHQLFKKPRKFIMKHAYWGSEETNISIKAKLEKANLFFVYCQNIEKKVAELISQGKIVARYNGRAEWGPRALGNRSILADPRDPKIREKLNAIKGREWFRPVCPSILEEKTPEFFGIKNSPFMLLAVKVNLKKASLIPGALHQDNTARIQTVNRVQNPSFYKIIKEFYKITGIPLLINTSFNFKGQPIVNSVEDVLACFFATGIDALAIGNFLIEK